VIDAVAVSPGEENGHAIGRTFVTVPIAAGDPASMQPTRNSSDSFLPDSNHDPLAVPSASVKSYRRPGETIRRWRETPLAASSQTEGSRFSNTEPWSTPTPLEARFKSDSSSTVGTPLLHRRSRRFVETTPRRGEQVIVRSLAKNDGDR
jgi:hypothetical protein